MKNKIFKLLFIALLGFTSCEDSLDVINENEPDFKNLKVKKLLLLFISKKCFQKHD